MRIQRLSTSIVAFAIVISVSVFFGCGGGGSSSFAPSPAPNPTPSSASIQVRVSDAPADRVVVFEMTLKSLVLSPKSGKNVTVISEPRRIEFARLASGFEPVAISSIPIGTYTKLTLVTADAHIAYVDDAGQVQEYTEKGDTSSILTLDPALTVDNTTVLNNALLNVELILPATITFIDGSNATPPKFSPVAKFSIPKVPFGVEKLTEETGGLQHAIGIMTDKGEGFTLKIGQNGIELPVVTFPAPDWQGAPVQSNTLVHVSALSSGDSLWATEVEGLTGSSGAVLDGIVADLFIPPGSSTPTSMTLIPQDGVGNGMLNELVGKPVIVDVSKAQYSVDYQRFKYPLRPLIPSELSGSQLLRGQKVRVDSDSGILSPSGQKGYSLTARQVVLEQQAVTGIVVAQPPTASVALNSPNYSKPTGEFWMQLPADSSFVLMGKGLMSSYMRVQLYADTSLPSGMTVADLQGKKVRVGGYVHLESYSATDFRPGVDATRIEIVAPLDTTAKVL